MDFYSEPDTYSLPSIPNNVSPLSNNATLSFTPTDTSSTFDAQSILYYNLNQVSSESPLPSTFDQNNNNFNIDANNNNFVQTHFESPIFSNNSPSGSSSSSSPSSSSPYASPLNYVASTPSPPPYSIPSPYDSFNSNVQLIQNDDLALLTQFISSSPPSGFPL